LTQDPAPQLAANPLCLTQSRRKLNLILQEKQNGQPREELMLQQEKQTFGSSLPNLPPVACCFKHKFKVDRNAKSASYNIILGCNAIKELPFDLLYSKNVPKIQFKQEVKIDCKPRGFWSRPHFHQVYFQTQQSTIEKAEEEFLEK
jgi:hypothetical protein